MGCKVIEVVAGVIFDGSKVLAAQRPEDKACAGSWEFPGGKLEPGESPAAALQRELREELALDVQLHHSMYRLEFMPEVGKQIILHFIRAQKQPGSEPQACEGQKFRWLGADELGSVAWLPSDKSFVEYLYNIMNK